MQEKSNIEQKVGKKGHVKTDIKNIPLVKPEIFLEIKKRPFMGYIFLKAFLISPFRSNSIKNDSVVNKAGIILKKYVPDKKLIADYRKDCSFAEKKPDIIPISCIQTIFIGLLGKFITSSFFPISPLGLIHIFQSFKQIRPVKTDEVLNLYCTLESIKKTEKGIETSFDLKALSGNEPVWQGTSVFLTKRKSHTGEKKKKKSKAGNKEKILSLLETISVPSDIGLQYARVSGDYNPHHLSSGLAKLFGFKRSIAHGMWSLARVIASLDRRYGIDDAAYIEASFKLPIFIPAKTNLGYEDLYDKKNHQNIINFELRDEQNQLPHLKGMLKKKESGSYAL